MLQLLLSFASPLFILVRITAPKEEWPIISNAIFVPFGNKMMEIPADEYLIYAREKGAKNLGAIQESDEACSSQAEFFPYVDYVVRRYHCPKTFKRFPNTLWIPNGWADGVGPKDPTTLVTASHREFQCFFKGRETPERAEFVTTMKSINADCILDFSEGFGKGDIRPAYSAALGNSKFAPCPAGNSPETIRFYDVLENGAIPVLVESKFTRFLVAHEGLESSADLPFIVLQDWTEYNSAVAPYLADESKLNELQRRSITFWVDMKQKTHDGARTLVDAAFAKNGGV